MNKLLIVLLAVCLFSVVSAHTFVKRDVPTADDMTAQVNAVKDKLTEFSNNISKQFAESVNPETIKKTLNDIIDAATKAAEDLKAATVPAGDAKPAAA